MIIRVIAGLLVLILAAGVLITPAMAAESGVTVKLHYNRHDGNYADWSVWFWVPPGPPKRLPSVCGHPLPLP